MRVSLLDFEEVKEQLLSTEWITLNFGDDDFPMYLEVNYFSPGTPKNAEFETMTIPYGKKITLWFRIKNSPINRKNLYNALDEFYGEKPINFDFNLEDLRDGIKTFIKELEGFEKTRHLQGKAIE